MCVVQGVLLPVARAYAILGVRAVARGAPFDTQLFCRRCVANGADRGPGYRRRFAGSCGCVLRNTYRRQCRSIAGGVSPVTRTVAR